MQEGLQAVGLGLQIGSEDTTDTRTLSDGYPADSSFIQLPYAPLVESELNLSTCGGWWLFDGLHKAIVCICLLDLLLD